MVTGDRNGQARFTSHVCGMKLRAGCNELHRNTHGLGSITRIKCADMTQDKKRDECGVAFKERVLVTVIKSKYEQ